ncbi:hypothetical protein HMPREF3208_00224 [Gardnerella vaginalis]|uniref:Uncharacterized protein n=1 Tax=Gardnerella vaginalis TaxID=2702 RepID=A0A133P2F1_GARVA|nr:hypothetical protein HMPREF3208_00224 [Gardnerella vaginalis]
MHRKYSFFIRKIEKNCAIYKKIFTFYFIKIFAKIITIETSYTENIVP